MLIRCSPGYVFWYVLRNVDATSNTLVTVVALMIVFLYGRCRLTMLIFSEMYEMWMSLSQDYVYLYLFWEKHNMIYLTDVHTLSKYYIAYIIQILKSEIPCASYKQAESAKLQN